ncbi:Transporter LysE family [Salmonella enterica subsp. enterica]|nr:Transporter LysE family [Salmonella enterica subsp. enterica]
MTPMLLSAFWTYTLITALTPGPNNILALSAATAHGFRQSIRVLAGMSLGFLVVMLLCAGIAFSLAVIDPANHSFAQLGGGCVYPVAGVENCYQSSGG